jgi:hypothetical protein
MVTPPTITVRIAITIATMGRLIKNLDMILAPSDDTRPQDNGRRD